MSGFYDFNATQWQAFRQQIESAAVIDGVTTENTHHLNFYRNTATNHTNQYTPHSDSHSNSYTPYSNDHTNTYTPHSDNHNDVYVPYNNTHVDQNVPHSDGHTNAYAPHSDTHNDVYTPHSDNHTDANIPHADSHADTVTPHTNNHTNYYQPYNNTHTNSYTPHSNNHSDYYSPYYNYHTDDYEPHKDTHRDSSTSHKDTLQHVESSDYYKHNNTHTEGDPYSYSEHYYAQTDYYIGYDEDGSYTDSGYDQDADYTNRGYNEDAYYTKSGYSKAATYSQSGYQQEAAYSQTGYNKEATHTNAGYTQAASYNQTGYDKAEVYTETGYDKADSYVENGYTKAAYYNKTGYDKSDSYTDTGYSKAAYYTQSGYDKADSYVQSGYTKAAFYTEAGYLQQVAVNYTELSHRNVAPSTPKSFAADAALVKRNITLAFHSYDPDDNDDNVFYQIKIRKTKNLKGEADVSGWVTLQDWSTNELLDLDTIDLLKTGNTSLADSQGTYEIQVQAKNRITVTNRTGSTAVKDGTGTASTEVKENFSKVLTTTIVVNQALQPSIENTNYASYFKYYFGRTSAHQVIGTAGTKYTDVSKALIVNMKILDYNMAPVSGTLTLRSEDGSKYVSLPINFSGNGSTSQVSNGTWQDAYVMFSAEQLTNTFGAYDLTRAKFEVVVNTAAPDGTKTTSIVTEFTDAVDPQKGYFGWLNLDLKIPTVNVTESGNIWRQSKGVKIDVADNGTGLYTIDVLHCVNGVWTTFESVSGLGGAKTWSKSYSLTVSPQIRVVATDGSGNSVTKDVNVKFMDPYKPTNPLISDLLYNGKYGEPGASAQVNVSNLLDKLPTSSFKTYIQANDGSAKTQVTYGNENMSFETGYGQAVVANNKFTMKPGVSYTAWQEDLAGNVSSRVPFGYPDPNGLIIPGNARTHAVFEVSTPTGDSATNISWILNRGGSVSNGSTAVTPEAQDIVGTDAVGYPRRFIVTNLGDQGGSFEKNANTRVFSMTYINDGGTRILGTLGSYTIKMEADTVSVEFNGVPLWSKSGMPIGTPNTIMARLHTDGMSQNEILLNGILYKFGSQADFSPAYNVHFESFGQMYVSNVGIYEIGSYDQYSLSVMKSAGSSDTLNINDFVIDVSDIPAGTSKEMIIPSGSIAQLPNHVSLNDGISVLVENHSGIVTLNMKPEMDQMIAIMKEDKNKLGSNGKVNGQAVSLRMQEIVQMLKNGTVFRLDTAAMPDNSEGKAVYNLLAEPDVMVGTDGILPDGKVRVNGVVMTDEEFASKLANKEIVLRTPAEVMSMVRKNVVTHIDDTVYDEIMEQANPSKAEEQPTVSVAPAQKPALPQLDMEIQVDKAEIDLY